MRILGLFAGLIAFSLAAPAAADNWKRGESPHFVVYSTMSERDLTESLEDLERIDAAIRHVRGQSDPEVGDGNRVTIFMVDSVKDVQRLMDTDEDFAGFYTYREQGPIAIALKIGGKNAASEQRTFVHEYAHHLLLQTMRQPAPKWLVEGWAEYFSTAKVKNDGSVEIGWPSSKQADVLAYFGQVPLEYLFDQRREFSGDGLSAFYATSWLLTHFLSFDFDWRPQFNNYMQLMASGTPSREAATQAFGDLDGLEKALKAYRRGRISYAKIEAEKLPVPAISIVDLNKGDSAAVEAYAEYWLGQPDDGQLDRVRGHAAAHPDSGLLMTTLAMAELSDGDPVAAADAATRAIALRPGEVEPMMVKVRALIKQAQADGVEPDAKDALFEEALALARQAIETDPKDPEPLRDIYRVSIESGRGPDMDAVNSIYAAARIAPQDLGTRLNAAQILSMRGYKTQARELIEGIAHDPHNIGARESARRLIAQIEGTIYVPEIMTEVDLSGGD